MTPPSRPALPFFCRAAGLAAAAALIAGAAALAQPLGPPRPPGPPAAAGNMVAFEVLAIDPQTWLVTARNLDSGEDFGFRLPPEAFRGLRFRADLAGAQPGRRISVAGEPAARLSRARVERPLGAGGRSESEWGGPANDGRGPDRYAVPEGPGKYGTQEVPRDTSRYTDRPSPLGQRGAPGGPGLYEVMEFDPATATVTVRGEAGETVSLELDPQAFVGYRFRASVGNLMAGQAFEIEADNERPLADCCTVKERRQR